VPESKQSDGENSESTKERSASFESAPQPRLAPYSLLGLSKHSHTLQQPFQITPNEAIAPPAPVLVHFPFDFRHFPPLLSLLSQGKMVKISDKIKNAEREGRPWWSFEFFPCAPFASSPCSSLRLPRSIAVLRPPTGGSTFTIALNRCSNSVPSSSTSRSSPSLFSSLSEGKR
jgi:hypothetical protein